MKSPWPEVALGGLLKEISRRIEVKPSMTYCLLGMRWYAGGLFVKDELLGNQIKAKYLYEVKKGDFVYNRLFAWKGSFGLATPNDDGCFVSNEFPCFEVNNQKILPSFLRWYFSAQSVWNEVEILSTGSSRQSRLRLKQERFLKIKIPLPSLSEQKRIVTKIDQVASGVLEATDIQARLEEEYFKLLLSKIREISAGADCHPLKQVVPIVRRHVELKKNEMYPELGIRSFGKGTFHKPAVKGSDLGRKRLYEIKPGDLLFSNVFSWEGAIAVAQTHDNNRFGSHRFITCVPDPQKATSNFICHYFLTQEGITKIRAASPGAAGRNKTLGLKKLEEIEVPLPSIKAQIEFDKLLHHIITLKESHKKRQVDLDKILPSVLDRAFKGEL